jgi:hypothetical protein
MSPSATPGVSHQVQRQLGAVHLDQLGEDHALGAAAMQAEVRRLAASM